MGYNLNGISANPQFNDSANNVYTVKQTSPCLFRGESGAHIGVGEAFYLGAGQLLYYASGNIIDNFGIVSGRLVRTDESMDARLVTDIIDIGNTSLLQRAYINALLGVVAGSVVSMPTVISNQYPAYDALQNYHSGSGVTDSSVKYRSITNDNLGNTPATETSDWERMTWESGVAYDAGKIVQYTDDVWYKANTTTATSWDSDEWDAVLPVQSLNMNFRYGRTYELCEAADWTNVVFDLDALFDSAGLGRGDSDYDSATGAYVTIRFIQVEIHAKTVA